VILLDVNVLIYAGDPISPQHGKVANWLQDLSESAESIGFSLPTLWAFVRITTDRRLSSHPRTPTGAFERVREWLSQPYVRVVDPGPRHLEILERLVIDFQAHGPRVSDAVLAALAIEHGATLASTDRDFSRFPSLRWVNPLDEA
jgi:uncharacterized protein